MMRVGTSFADWSHQVIQALGGRRVVLVPQSQGGTPASIQDVRETLPSTTLVEADVPSTFPVSSGAVRRHVLVNNSPMAQGEMLASQGVDLVGDWFWPRAGTPQSVQDTVPSPGIGQHPQ